jgi:transcriptional regulator with XRE-family HTH domain
MKTAQDKESAGKPDEARIAQKPTVLWPAGSNIGSGEPKQPETTVGLSKKQAEILLRGDLANLAKKVKDGKTLSASERNLLQSSLDGGRVSAAEYVDNAVELAEVLGVTRRTISRWKKIEGAPQPRPDGRLHVPSWRAFKRQHGRDEEDDDEIDPKREKARNILLQNERLEVQIAVLKRNWMPTQEVERMGGELGAAIRKVVNTIHLAAPNVVGVSVAEAEQRLKEIEDEVLQQLHLLNESVEEWKNSTDEPAP